MGNYTMKTCALSGKRFKANSTNFYANSSSPDGFHPYHKSFDNFRRVTGATVDQVRTLINLVK